jgi:hypothetical protein
MSDFLNNLAARSLSLADAVQPRIRSLFEPQAAQVNQPARFSVQLSPEDRAAREDEPSSRMVLESSESSASTLEQSTRSNSITSSLKPSADAAAARRDDRDAASHRAEPARARGSTYTVSILPKEALDLSRPPAPDATVARKPAADRRTVLTTSADLAPQIRDEREGRATLVPNIRRMVDDPINRLEAQASAPMRAEQTPANQPAAASPARTITPAQVGRAPELPVAHLRSPAPVAERSPEIKITIGRVDVKAVMPAQPAARSQPPARFAPTSLDDYLRERSGGRR